MEQNQSNQQLNKQELYELKHQQKLAEQAGAVKKKMLKKISKIALILLLAGGSTGWFIWYATNQPSVPSEVADVTKTCVQHGRLGMHIHPILRIVVNGEDITIPANTGIPSPSCMRLLHTHDKTGTLHIESKEIRDFRLKEFFAVWDKPFNRNQIIDHEAGEKHRIRVMVNGIENNEFENLVMHDGDKIVIYYEEIQ